MNTKEKIAAYHKLFIKGLNGTAKPPFNNLRAKALESFVSKGFPTNRQEAYKYTSIEKWTNKNLVLDQKGVTTSSELAGTALKDIPASLLELDFDKFHCVNGKLIEADPSPYVSTLQSYLFENDQKVIEQHHDLDNEDALASLNLAFAEEGWVINVPKNHTAKRGILVLHYVDSNMDKFVNTTNYLFLEENSEVEIIECFYGPGSEDQFFNQSTVGQVGKSARGSYYKLQLQQSGMLVDNCNIDIQQNSNFSIFTISDGPDIVRNNLSLSLKGEYSEGNLFGVFLGKGKKHIDNYTTVDHLVPNCESNELYKGILDDKSHGVFNGRIFVRPDAQKTNAFQSNKCILLSDDATINTKPQLEIWADDVKCSHGATTGQLDAEPIFYLRSRGLSEDEAQKLLLKAFVIDVINKVNNQLVKKTLETILENQLIGIA